MKKNLIWYNKLYNIKFSISKANMYYRTWEDKLQVPDIDETLHKPPNGNLCDKLELWPKLVVISPSTQFDLRFQGHFVRLEKGLKILIIYGAFSQ